MNNKRDLEIYILNDKLNDLSKVIKKLPENIYNEKIRINTENGLEKINTIKITYKRGYNVKIQQLQEVVSSSNRNYLKFVEISEKEAVQYLSLYVLNDMKEKMAKNMKDLKTMQDLAKKYL